MTTPLNRRTFLSSTAAAVTANTLLNPSSQAQDSARPNILWITSEDNGPHLGAYGDTYADTPNLDALAAKGMIFTNAWSTAPVCAPARTTIISGMYPPCLGAEHMRSQVPLPSNIKMYPQYLREAGYYCTNNSKEDYNLKKPGKVWDESSGKAHFRNRANGQPFFAIFNFTTTHESQIRKRPHDQTHDPDKVSIPAYHPDTPEVRQDWAQYHDKMTQMDAQAGEILKQLEEDGLAEDTIIMYYGDHGAGMPRSKRWPYNSGLHVPMIAYIPPKFRHLAPDYYQTGGKSDRLVGFIDLAPTVLSLAGIKPPEHMQGHTFLGKHTTPEQPFAFGFRGRMDERYDMVRTVRDKRYVYIRNYMPHKVYGQYLQYMFVTPTTQVWKKMYDEGKLNDEQSKFWQTKPAEELYDLQNDPDEINNLADSAEHQSIKLKLRMAQMNKAKEIRDVGFLPENEIHERATTSTPFEMGHDPNKYNVEKVMDAAELASFMKPSALPKIKALLNDDDSAVRYWGAMGILMQEESGTKASHAELVTAMKDSAPAVRIIAAEALGRYGDDEDAQNALDTLLPLANVNNNSFYVATIALNSIDKMEARAKSVVDQIAKLPIDNDNAPARASSYVGRLVERISTKEM